MNKFSIHYDDFSAFIDKNIFLPDLAETRRFFFEFVEKYIVI